VKRPLGSNLEEVNTFERSHRRTAIEESKERAKRAAVQPRRPKGYVYPTDRVRPTLHSKIEEKPKINEERLSEYQKRKQMNSANKVSFDDPVPTGEAVQGNLFSREATDYFKRKRESLFDRGIQ
jgi:DNA invertase Pin-like site-specific DNA recombinase